VRRLPAQQSVVGPRVARSPAAALALRTAVGSDVTKWRICRHVGQIWILIPTAWDPSAK
jgi:hypothetical protein